MNNNGIFTQKQQNVHLNFSPEFDRFKELMCLHLGTVNNRGIDILQKRDSSRGFVCEVA